MQGVPATKSKQFYKQNPMAPKHVQRSASHGSAYKKLRAQLLSVT